MGSKFINDSSQRIAQTEATKTIDIYQVSQAALDMFREHSSGQMLLHSKPLQAVVRRKKSRPSVPRIDAILLLISPDNQ